jgi:pimeloyl-ACP methyl ester carboxylesterase
MMVTDTVRRYGNAPFKVAVIHGGPGAPGSIAPVAREFCSDRGVLEPLQSADSIDGQVEELKAQLGDCADLPVTLIGHSWGAWLALILAARYPEMVSKLILVGSGPFEAGDAQSTTENRLSRLSETARAEARAIMKALGDADADRNRLMARLGDLMGKTDAFDPLPHDNPDALPFQGGVNFKVWEDAKALRESGKLLEIAKDIRCPVVAIHGDYDPHPADGVEKPLSAVLSDFRFIPLADCGHEPWIEKQARDEFFEILRRELGD